MWHVLMMACAQATNPAPADAAAVDCDAHPAANQPACEADVSRLASLEASLASMDCTKGRKKKQDECKAEVAELQLKKAEIEAQWVAPTEAPATRGVMDKKAASDDEEALGDIGKSDHKMDMDIDDE